MGMGLDRARRDLQRVGEHRDVADGGAGAGGRGAAPGPEPAPAGAAPEPEGGAAASFTRPASVPQPDTGSFACTSLPGATVTSTPGCSAKAPPWPTASRAR